MALLGGYAQERLPLAGTCLSVLGVGLFFYSTTQLTNGILQAHGHATRPAIHVLVGGVLKMGVVYLLSGNPALGIVGVGIGSSLCNAFVTVLNLITIARIVPEKPRLVKNFFRSLLPSLLMGAAAWGTWQGLRHVLGAGGSRVLLCGVPIVAGVIVYCVLAILCKSITREDCLLLPKGEKIANILHL